MIIGLTGSSGSGKTTISNIFKEHGYYIINADEIAHNITSTDDACIQEITDEFGSKYIDQNGCLKRRELGELVFSDSQKLSRLNEILHPKIIFQIKSKINLSNSEYILIDAPLLIQSGADFLCDKIIAVVADDDLKLKRITERDNISEKQAKNRLFSQPANKYYTNVANYVIINNNTIDDIKNQVIKIINKFF